MSSQAIVDILSTPQSLADAIEQRLAASAPERHALAAEAKSIAAALDLVTLAGPEDAHRFQEGLSRLATVRKTLQHRQKQAADPLHAAWKKSRAFWQPGIEWCETVEQACDRKMLAYTTEQRRKAAAAAEAKAREEEEARRKRDEEIAKAERARTEAGREKALGRAEKHEAAAALASIEAAAIVDPGGSVKTSSGTGYTVELWDFSIVDPAAVPREFLCVDQGAVREALQTSVRRMKAEGRQTPALHIPGIEFTAREEWRKR